jgi:hypothetical protein
MTPPSPHSTSDDFPTLMSPQELMDIVRSGPRTLKFCSIVRFAVGRPDEPALPDFVHALKTCDTIRSIHCNRHFTTGFSDDEWCDIVRSFGQVHNLEELVFVDGGDSRLRRVNLGVLTHVLTHALTLEKLLFGKNWLLVGDETQRKRFVIALSRLPCLRHFEYAGCGCFTELYQAISPRSSPTDLLLSFSSCRDLRCVRITNSTYFAPDYSCRLLEQFVQTCANLTELSIVTKPANWPALLRSKSIEHLTLTHCDPTGNRLSVRQGTATSLGWPQQLMSDDDVERCSRDLALNSQLRHVSLRFWSETFPANLGTALANQLEKNIILRFLELSDYTGQESGCRVPNPTLVVTPFPLDVPTLKKFSKCLNTSNLHLQIRIDIAAGNDEVPEREMERIRMESILNSLDCRRWMTAETNSMHHDDCFSVFERLEEKLSVEPTSFMLQSCLFEIVRANPLICCRPNSQER